MLPTQYDHHETAPAAPSRNSTATPVDSDSDARSVHGKLEELPDYSEKPTQDISSITGEFWGQDSQHSLPSNTSTYRGSSSEHNQECNSNEEIGEASSRDWLDWGLDINSWFAHEIDLALPILALLGGTTLYGTVGPIPKTDPDDGTKAKISETPKNSELSDDAFSHLPEFEAEILRRQVSIPKVKVGIKTLYRYATTTDRVIIAFSALCAIVAGAVLPLMTVSIQFDSHPCTS